MGKSKAHKGFDKQFGSFVKKKRMERGWSQPELASKINNNFQNVSRLERGEITPTLFWCYKLSDAFDIGLEDFIREFGYKVAK